MNKKDMHLPQWHPQKTTLKKINDENFRIRYKALRNSSSGFIKREDVREYVFGRDHYQCVQCGSREDLQVDHIISVYKISKEKLNYRITNCSSNLQTLCGKCNYSKLP